MVQKQNTFQIEVVPIVTHFLLRIGTFTLVYL